MHRFLPGGREQLFFRFTISATAFCSAPIREQSGNSCGGQRPVRGLWGETVGFPPLSGLTTKALTARLRRSDAGADALLEQFTLEVSDAGEIVAFMRRAESLAR